MRRDNAAPTDRCIYDDGDDFDEEHWLPRLFGSFGYEPLKRKICRSCNGALGELDHRVSVLGPGAIVRSVSGIVGRHDVPTNPTYFEAASDPANKLILHVKEHGPLYMESFEGGQRPAGQIIVETAEGARCILVNPNWPDEVFRRRIERDGLAGRRVLKIFGLPSEMPKLEKLVRGCLRLQDTELFGSDGHVSREVVRGEHLLDVRYFRGIAKMALGYCLWAMPEISGREPQLGLVRDYVRWGVGNTNHFFLPSEVAQRSPLNQHDWPGLAHLSSTGAAS